MHSFIFFVFLLTLAPIRGTRNIHTLAEVSEQLSEQVSRNPSFTPFSGTGHVLGGTPLPSEAFAEARVAHFEGGESLASQGLAHLADAASRNVDTAQATLDATLGHCLRSGSGCTGSM